MLYSIILNSQGDYHYYYKGDKQNLSVNTLYAYIGGDTLNLGRFLFENHSLLRNYDTNYYIKGYSAIEFLDTLSLRDYFSMLRSIKNRYRIFIEPYFINNEFDKIGSSEYFYVKLYSVADSSILHNIADSLNCEIVSQDRYMPLWYTLRKDIRSTYNSVELAKIFYELNLFSAVEPDLMTEGILSNDEYYSDQWSLKNTGQYCNIGHELDIDVENAWNITKGDSILVAVLDQGIDNQHPDL